MGVDQPARPSVTAIMPVRWLRMSSQGTPELVCKVLLPTCLPKQRPDDLQSGLVANLKDRCILLQPSLPCLRCTSCSGGHTTLQSSLQGVLHKLPQVLQALLQANVHKLEQHICLAA